MAIEVRVATYNCGIWDVGQFNGGTEAQLDHVIDSAYGGKILTASLNHHQFYPWADRLKARGFVPVASGCNVGDPLQNDIVLFVRPSACPAELEETLEVINGK